MKLEVLIKQPQDGQRATPLLLVHGAWHGAWCWEDHFLPYFAAQGYSTYALSLRGHAGSEGRAALRWTSIWQYVADVAQVADQIAREQGARPVVIGHSMGGLITQRYLERHCAPAAVVIASVPPHGIIPLTLRSLRKHPRVVIRLFATLTPYTLIETPALAHEYLYAPDTPRAEVERLHARTQDESFRALLDMALFSLPRPARVKTPLLVLGAEKDALFTPHEVRRTASAYNAPVEIFPDAAHNLIAEADWRRPAEAITAWLRGQGI